MPEIVSLFLMYIFDQALPPKDIDYSFKPQITHTVSPETGCDEAYSTDIWIYCQPAKNTSEVTQHVLI